jgi:adenine phosphoribosyltransferase
VALERLRASLVGAPVVQFGDYPYFVHPITDGLPLGDPEVLREVIDALAEKSEWRCDKIVTAEAMGFPLAAGLAMKVGRPYVFMRKRRYGLLGELSVRQATGYAASDLYLNNVGAGDRVVFVDDVLSTGGTLRAVVGVLRKAGAEIAEVLIVFEKTDRRRELEQELGVPIRTLLRVAIRDGRMVEVT